ncbi:MAG: hypothetical protein U0X73_08380 [Thermoanaerobaculia bacterium]
MLGQDVPQEENTVHWSIVIIKRRAVAKTPFKRTQSNNSIAAPPKRALSIDCSTDLMRKRFNALAVHFQEARERDRIRAVRGPTRKALAKSIHKVVIIAVPARVVERPNETLSLNNHLALIDFVGVERLRLGRVANLHVEASSVSKCCAFDRIQVVDEWLNESLFTAA